MSSLRDNLAAAVGPEAVHESQAEEIAFAVRPPDREALAKLVRTAERDRFGLQIVGGGTDLRQARSSAEPRATVRVDLGHWNTILHHAEGDLTLTVAPGVTLEQAQHHLLDAGQELPFVAAQPERTTVAGLVARGIEGPWLKGYGRLSHQLLGIETCAAHGHFVRGGGRVVKNVSGYDLVRLMVGARGAYGILTEVTVRLRARPERSIASLVACRDLRAALAWGAQWRNDRPDTFGLFAVAGDWVESFDAPSPAGVLVVMRGKAAVVEEQRRSIADRAAADGLAIHELEQDPTPILADPIAPDWGSMRFSVRPSRLKALVSALHPWMPSEDEALRSRVLIDLEAGIMQLGRAEGLPLPEETEVALGGALELLEATIDLPRDPGFFARRYRNFPSCRPGGLELLRSLKTGLDPEGVFNPQRQEWLA